MFPWFLAGVLVCLLSMAAWGVHAKAESAQQQKADQQAPPEQPGVGAELARETREAAGEEDHNSFKKSSAVYCWQSS